MAMKLVPLEKPHASFFWSAPFVDDGDFLPLDPLALDYLGQQVGLWLFPSLTTRTNRAQYYAVVLYGLRLVEMAIEEYGERSDDETRAKLFARWERFWAMAVLASRDGALERGHPDAMRGIRGAKRAWIPGDRPLPLDYALISRQEELGALGAYLSSLRSLQLVIPGSYKPTRCDEPLLDAFWDEVDSPARIAQYERYALTALDRNRSTIERRLSNITLAEVGRRSRLTCLTERKRTLQQARLDERILQGGAAFTSVLAALIERTWKAGIQEPLAVIERTLANDHAALDERLRDLLVFARAFGRFSQSTLQAFNDLYGYVVDQGWIAPAGATIAAVFDASAVESLHRIASEFLDTECLPRFKNLPVHAHSLVRFATTARSGSADEIVEALLAHHVVVRQERKQGGGWIRRNGDDFVIDTTSFSPQRGDVRFPSLRIDTVQSLLFDVGRIAQ